MFKKLYGDKQQRFRAAGELGESRAARVVQDAGRDRHPVLDTPEERAHSASELGRDARSAEHGRRCHGDSGFLRETREHRLLEGSDADGRRDKGVDELQEASGG